MCTQAVSLAEGMGALVAIGTGSTQHSKVNRINFDLDGVFLRVKNQKTDQSPIHRAKAPQTLTVLHAPRKMKRPLEFLCSRTSIYHLNVWGPPSSTLFEQTFFV